ncbi:MAG: family 16 glycoside hydrolase [Verrucomicrobiota bacterium]
MPISTDPGDWLMRLMKVGLLAVTVGSGLTGCTEQPEREKAPTAEPISLQLIEPEGLHGWKALDDWVGGGAEVRVEDGVLQIGAGAPMNGIMLDEETAEGLPNGPYEINVEARRVDGRDIFFGLTFPVPERDACVTLVAGGWGGGITGVSSIDYRDASQNSTMSDQQYENGRWYAFRIEVRRDDIRVWLDGRIIVNAFIRDRHIGMRPGEVEQVQPFGLITWETVGEVRGLRVTELRE